MHAFTTILAASGFAVLGASAAAVVTPTPTYTTAKQSLTTSSAIPYGTGAETWEALTADSIVSGWEDEGTW